MAILVFYFICRLPWVFNEVLTLYYTTQVSVEGEPIFDNFQISPIEATPLAITLGIRDKISMEVFQEN